MNHVFRVPIRVPIRVPGWALTVCLLSVFPCAFALLRRATQRVSGLGEAFYLDKTNIIAPSKGAKTEPKWTPKNSASARVPTQVLCHTPSS